MNCDEDVLWGIFIAAALLVRLFTFLKKHLGSKPPEEDQIPLTPEESGEEPQEAESWDEFLEKLGIRVPPELAREIEDLQDEERKKRTLPAYMRPASQDRRRAAPSPPPTPDRAASRVEGQGLALDAVVLRDAVLLHTSLAHRRD